MSRGLRRWIALALLALPAVAPADVLLDGHNHVGNCDDTGGGCTGFTPLDPVSRNNNFSTPMAFHLSTTTTIDKVTLNGAISLDGKLNIYIQPLFGATVFRSGTLSGSEWDLIPDLVLAPGYYSVLPDGGCSDLKDGTYFYPNCAGSGDNDFGFSSITLVSAQTSTSRMLIQRRHPGNNTLAPTDNDSDDDYDISDTVAPYYPDLSEPYPMDMSFNLDQNRRLSEIRFYRLRDVDNAFPSQGQLLIDGQAVGAFVDSGDPLELNPTLISTNFLALAGNHTLRVQLGVISGSDVDSFSWDSITLHTVDVTTPGTLGAFNGVDGGQAAVNGVIQTKIANKGFNLDLYALNPLGTGVNTSYTGTVTVDLLNATSDAGSPDLYGCRSSWSLVQTLGSVTFGGGDNGKKGISGVKYADALKIARVRITDNATGASGCSTDAFAIRPKEFQGVASDNDPATPGLTRTLPSSGYSGTTTPFHKAGQPFTLTVTPQGEGGANVAGYVGEPTVVALASAMGAVKGDIAVAPGSWTVVGVTRVSNAVTYSEAGAVTLRITDTTFANVDLADGSTTAERYIVKDDVKVGRFIPDHFKATKSDFSPGCGTFTYAGQAFGFPAGVGVTLTAESAANTTTLNYTGSLFRLDPADGVTMPAASFSLYDDPGIAGTPALNLTSATPTVSDQANGSGGIIFPNINVVRPATPSLDPFRAQVGLSWPGATDADGVTTSGAPVVLGTATAGGGTPFTGGANWIRFGRLYIQPSVGSDRAPLAVSVRTEYWDGVTFVPASGDTCTSLQAANVTLTAVPGASPAQTRTLAPAGPGPGPWTVTLSAPNVVGQAQLSVDLSTVGPYLFLLDDDADVDANFDDNPSAQASFGVFNRTDNRIYQREIYR